MKTIYLLTTVLLGAASVISTSEHEVLRAKRQSYYNSMAFAPISPWGRKKRDAMELNVRDKRQSYYNSMAFAPISPWGRKKRDATDINVRDKRQSYYNSMAFAPISPWGRKKRATTEITGRDKRQSYYNSMAFAPISPWGRKKRAATDLNIRDKRQSYYNSMAFAPISPWGRKKRAATDLNIRDKRQSYYNSMAFAPISPWGRKKRAATDLNIRDKRQSYYNSMAFAPISPWGRKKRAATDLNIRDKRQSYYNSMAFAPISPWGRKKRAATDLNVRDKRQSYYNSMAFAPISPWGRKKRAATDLNVRDKRQSYYNSMAFAPISPWGRKKRYAVLDLGNFHTKRHSEDKAFHDYTMRTFRFGELSSGKTSSLIRSVLRSGQIYSATSRLLIATTTQMADSGKRGQAAWNVPVNARPPPQLTLYNSLTRNKEVFVPNEGKRVKWYICGPTVYDSSHMGHARAYLSFDILRRVLTNYFGYDIQWIMNITDIDDKIIKRARQRHLLTSYLEKHKDAIALNQVIKDVLSALSHFQKKYDDETDPDKKKMYDTMIGKVQKSSEELEAALKKGDKESAEIAKGKLVNDARDVLSDWLDSQFGHTINDHAVFDSLAKTYEDEFLADMARLNVLPADILTRVSEYVPEVVTYVEKIIKNGYAYATQDGSVYFDTEAFAANKKHFYAKLVPEAYGDSENLLKNMREGEGELSMGADQMQQKKSPTDFALWKTSKAGEPFWDSPWGKGRPGWHIECSAMSSEVCGSKLDVHAGGLDLKFPHHDNEIAQCEAHYDESHWVNYFLHCGTLRIAGLKMSKSLKNFITIREALKQYTARQLRILFLMHNWSDVLDYSAATMERALQFEKVTQEFFLLVKDHLRRHYRPDNSQGYQKYEKRELTLLDEFFRIKNEIHLALCDSVDTRTTIEKIRELIVLGNAYIIEKEKEQKLPNSLLLRSIALHITQLMKTFGAIPQNQDIGFPTDSGDSGNATSEEVLMPYLTALADFREVVRNIAKENKVIPILEACDRLRDDTLPELGVRLEDRANQTCVKLVDRETLLREQEQKKMVEAQKQAEKDRKAKEKAEKEAAKRIRPEELFTKGEEASKYSKFDEKGIPTHTVEGEEISKKQRKKLEKLWETQQKNYQTAMAAQNGTNGTA